ncbi:hypothetical protein D9M70_528900 [compost metagenome]
MRKPAQSRRMRSTCTGVAMPSARMRSASLLNARPAWVTISPGLSVVTAGKCPTCSASSPRRATTESSVRSPRTTSTIFISGTGLKKCRPATRCGYLQALAIWLTDSDEVLLASTASSATNSSS